MKLSDLTIKINIVPLFWLFKKKNQYKLVQKYYDLKHTRCQTKAT